MRVSKVLSVVLSILCIVPSATIRAEVYPGTVAAALEATAASGDAATVAGRSARLFDRSAERSSIEVAPVLFVDPRSAAPRALPVSHADGRNAVTGVPVPSDEKNADVGDKDCEPGFGFVRGLIDAMKGNFGGHIVEQDEWMPHGKCSAYKRGRRTGHFASIILSGVEVAGGAALVGAQIIAAVACTASPAVLICWKALVTTLSASIVALIHGLFQLHAAILNLDEQSRLSEGDVVRMLPGEIVENPPGKLRNRTVFKVKSEGKTVYIAVHALRPEEGKEGRTKKHDKLMVFDEQWKCLGIFSADLRTHVDDCPAGY